MTSVNSIIVELGLIGFSLFLLFHIYLIKMILHDFRYYKDNFYLFPFFIFFILNLFYLNYWEDPALTIPIFSFLAIYSNKNKK